jgi:hypothetical protein
VFAIIAALFAASSPASSEVTQTGPNSYVAGIRSVEFKSAQQEDSLWCWAASIEMVLDYHGLTVPQESVVERIYGSKINRTGDPRQILTALSGLAPNKEGGASQIYAEGYTGLYPYFVTDLINEYPLIIGLNFGSYSHAVVLTAVAYSMNANGQPVPASVVIRDPWPGNPPRQEVPMSQIVSGCFFSARIATFPY